MKRVLAIFMVFALLVVNIPPVTANANEYQEPAMLMGISVNTLPDKTEYWMGEELDTTGLTLTANYSDGSTAMITEGFNIDYFDSWMCGERPVTVYYEGCWTEFNVTVIGVTGVSIKTLPDKTEYFRGEWIDTTGMTLTLHYSNGTTKDVTDGFYVDYYDSYMTGTQTVYVRYENHMVDFEVTVTIGGYCGDNITWVYDEATGVLTISGNGMMSDWSNPWSEWAYSMNEVVIEDGVTNIGASAFSGCHNLKRITIPGSVNYIGDSAFRDCLNLTSVTILDGVQSIGDSAFSYCSNLTDINIPESVQYIGHGAFGYCTELAQIDLPDSITYIGDYAFHGCTKLESITIPEDVTYISSQTFYDCTGLTSITIPGNITCIGGDAFYNCSSLTTVYYQGYEENKPKVTIESGNDVILNAQWIFCKEDATRTGISVKGLPSKTVYWVNEELETDGLIIEVSYSDGEKILITEGFTVSDLDAATAGNKTVTVTYKEFTTTFTVTVKNKTGSCGDNLTWALTEEGVLTISGTGDMYDYRTNARPDYAPWYELRESITKVVIGNGVVGLGQYAFLDLTRLTDVSFANSVTEIREYAFQNCNTLLSVILPNQLAKLDEGVFFRCYGMTTVTIPVSLTEIGDFVFSSSSGLSTVNYLGNQKQKAQISIGQANEPLISATWNYNTQDNIAVTGITVKTLPEKTKYVMYEALDTKGLVLTATYSDNSTLDVTSGFTVSGFDYEAAGLKEITVTYDGYTATFEVTVIKGGTCGYNLTWVLDDNGVLTVSGTGAIYDYDRPWGEWYNEIYAVVIENGVTQIGAHAFSECYYMSSISIPQSVTNIGYGAFERCDGLYTVNYGGTKAQKSDIIIEEFNDSLTNVTWNCAKVAENTLNATTYESLEEALEEATCGTVRLLMDIKEKTVAVKPGVILDLNGHILTADLVVCMNGAVILDGGTACTGGGKLKVAKNALVYAPSENLQIIPVWNGTDGYLFTKVTFQHMTQSTGIEGTAKYLFLPGFSNRQVTAMLSDGGSDNGLTFKVCMTWNDGKTQQFYTYGDNLVETVYDGTGSMVFDLTISGIANITDMVINAEIVTDTGAVATGSSMPV